MPTSNQDSVDFLGRVTECLHRIFDALAGDLSTADAARIGLIRDRIEPGKMLRSRLALALLPTADADCTPIVRACAATELIHTATLFHDDVIDGASLRRGQPTLWKEVGPTGAILLGDLFFSASLELVLANGDLAQVASFVAKVREVCATEATHELVYRGQRVDKETSLRIARGKTGALFAFPAQVCAAGDAAKGRALEEAGYLIGTAYQVADDLVDEEGDERVVGKTLGTDRKRRKFTLAHAPGATEKVVLAQVGSLADQALALVAPWPDLAERLAAYVQQFLTSPTQLHFAKVS